MTAAGSDPRSVGSYVSMLGRVEAAYGDLDTAFSEDRFAALLGDLTYSTADSRAAVPNPSRITINGDLYSGLASLRSAVNKYRAFLNQRDGAVPDDSAPDGAASTSEVVDARTFGLERDLQAALRQSIGQLEPGLAIVDGGAEHSVASGRIDILASDAAGDLVVIELKAVRAGRDAVGQILSYMGDIAAETGKPVRGLLVAPDFDHRALAAIDVVDAVQAVRYQFTFSFGLVQRGV